MSVHRKLPEFGVWSVYSLAGDSETRNICETMNQAVLSWSVSVGRRE